MRTIPELAPITTGGVLHRFEVPGFRVTETFQHPRAVPAHSHARAHASFLLDGGYRERVDGREYDCSAGSVLIKPPGVSHSDAYTRPSVSLIVEIDDEVGAEPGARRLFERPRQADASAALGALIGIRREVRAGDDAAPLIVHGALLELLGKMARGVAAPVSSSAIGRAAEYVRDNFRSTITLRAVAEAADLPVSRLVPQFRSRMKCSVGEYQRRLRVNLALTLLHRRDLPLWEIALEAGFADQSHLTRVFREMTGATPATFRDTIGGH